MLLVYLILLNWFIILISCMKLFCASFTTWQDPFPTYSLIWPEGERLIENVMLGMPQAVNDRAAIVGLSA